jgi:hypothetical protein
MWETGKFVIEGKEAVVDRKVRDVRCEPQEIDELGTLFSDPFQCEPVNGG